MITLNGSENHGSEKGSYLAFVKGAPDVLLPKCKTYCSYVDGTVHPLDGAAKERLSELQSCLSRNAERVIMLCQRTYTPTLATGSQGFEQELLDDCLGDLTIIGFIGIFDSPRPKAAAPVASCRRAGIRVFMMTGDFALTGAAIARQVGIFSGEQDPDNFATIGERRRLGGPPDQDFLQSLLLEGSQISQLEDQDWEIVCAYQEIVFGRCNLEQKLLIINHLKKRGVSTAVTGDSVNDAPALKAADVRVAIVNGSDVALEAADLGLLGNFDAMVDGIRLGRLVFQNL